MKFTAASMLAAIALAGSDPACKDFVTEDQFEEGHLTQLCPDVGTYHTDKTITARICPNSKDPISGESYEKDPVVKAARERSLKLAIVNQIYGKSIEEPNCDVFCMYDPLNIGEPVSANRVGFIWRNGSKQCWDLVSHYTCFDSAADEWENAKAKVKAMCEDPSSLSTLVAPPGPAEESEPTNEMVPPGVETTSATEDCTPVYGVEKFTQEYLGDICASSGDTDKSTTAKICPGSIDPISGFPFDSTPESMAARTTSLQMALVNQMYSKCDSWCMYDPMHLGSHFSEKRVGFSWRGGESQCWVIVSDWHCYNSEEYQKALTKAENWCEAEDVDDDESMVPPSKSFEELQHVLGEIEEKVHHANELPIPAEESELSALLEVVEELPEEMAQLKNKLINQQK